MLILEAVMPASIRGQDIAWDRSKPGTVYGIIRATDEEAGDGISNMVGVCGSNVDRAPRRRHWPIAFKP